MSDARGSHRCMHGSAWFMLVVEHHQTLHDGSLTRKLYCIYVLYCALVCSIKCCVWAVGPYVQLAMSLSCVACEMKHCLFTVVSAIRHVIVSEQVKH